MEQRNLTCINCPLGCTLTVDLDDDGNILSVVGNACLRGETYAHAEVSAPHRMVTTTVPIDGGEFARVPVKSSHPIAKGDIFKWMRALKGFRGSAPIEIGQVLAVNLGGCGADLIATRSVRTAQDGRS